MFGENGKRDCENLLTQRHGSDRIRELMNILITWFKRRFSDPQVVVLVGLLALAAVLIFWAGQIMAPIFAALVIAYLLEGVIAPMEKHGLPRPVAIGLVFSVFMVCLLVVILVLLPILYRQVTQIIQEIPTFATWAKDQLLLLPERYPELISARQITDLMNVVQSELGRLGQRILTISVASVRSLAIFLVYLILVPLMVFFMLKDKVLLLNWFKQFLPSDYRLSAAVWQDVDRQIGSYIRGKCIEILIVWGASAFVFSLIGLQSPMLFGFFVGLSVLIPYVGVTVMTFPIAIMAYFQWGLSAPFGYAVGAYAVIQLLDGNLLAPLLLSEVVNLHPLAIVAAVLITGGLWGFWGVFFAVPLATVVQAVLRALPAKSPEVTS